MKRGDLFKSRETFSWFLIFLTRSTSCHQLRLGSEGSRCQVRKLVRRLCQVANVPCSPCDLIGQNFAIWAKMFCLGKLFWRSLLTIRQIFGQNSIDFGIFFQVYLLLGNFLRDFGEIFQTIWSHWMQYR